LPLRAIFVFCPIGGDVAVDRHEFELANLSISVGFKPSIDEVEISVIGPDALSDFFIDFD